MAAPCIVVLAERPEEALPLLEQFAAAQHAGQPCRLTLVVRSEPGRGRERRLLREHGWQVLLGGQAEAEALGGQLFRPGSCSTPAEATPPEVKVVAQPSEDLPPAPPGPMRSYVPALPVKRPGVRPANPVVQSNRKAAFLVATHHRPQLLEVVLQHLVRQTIPTGWSFEILVGGQPGDAGQQVTRGFANTRFWAVESPLVTDKLNYLARQTTADLLLLADDDDLQPRNRLEAAVLAFEQGAGWAASGVHRFIHLQTGKMARWSGKAHTGHVGTSVSVTRQLFLQVGGYPSVPSGKDGHLAHRLKAAGAVFRDISKDIGEGLICLQHEKNLNQRPFPARGVVAAKGKFEILGQDYWWLEHLDDAVRETLAYLQPRQELRVASLATIPSRAKQLQQVVQAVLPQVDRLNVYLNGFRDVPPFLQHHKITVARSQEHGDRGDAGKFFWVNEIEGYHISLDDDLRYPPDVVERLVAAVDRYGHRVAVSFHGSVIPINPGDYYRSRMLYHCAEPLSEDTPVHVLGTGITCFHTRHMKVTKEDFPEPNMADIWFALLGQQQQVPFLTLQRPRGYIVPLKVPTSIFGSSHRHDQSVMDTRDRQTALVKQVPWRLYTPQVVQASEAVSVSVFTYNRPESVLALLRDLVAERETYPQKVVIKVYDDASTKEMTAVQAYAKAHDIHYIRATFNYGKASHARWVTRAFQDARYEDAGFFVFLPDDVRLLPGGLARAVRLWESIENPRKATLSLGVCSGRVTVPCWTGIEPTPLTEEVWHTGWVDGLFLCGRPTLETLAYRVPPGMPNRDPKRGSGMGQAISQALVSQGRSLYRVAKSVVVNLPEVVVPSQMNPGLREEPILMLQPFNEPLEPPSEMTPMRLGDRTLSFRVFPNDHIGRILKSGALYEEALLQAIRAYNRPGIYLDVGAFIGTHTAFFAELCPATLVVAVEANPDHYSLLRANIEINHLNAYPVFGAVLDQSARAKSLPAGEGNRGMARTAPGGDLLGYGLAELMTSEVAVIKIDVEGQEASVLRSGAAALYRQRPLIVAEAATQEALGLIERELPPGYVRSGRYCSTPTYIWCPRGR